MKSVLAAIVSLEQLRQWSLRLAAALDHLAKTVARRLVEVCDASYNIDAQWIVASIRLDSEKLVEIQLVSLLENILFLS